MANAMYINAGKFEHDGSKNYKYCSEPFDSWDAVVSHVLEQGLQNYPFCEVDFNANGHVHTMDFKELMAGLTEREMLDIEYGD